MRLNFTHFRAIFRKEIIDILRDRRTWMTSLILPVAVIPLISIVLSFGIQNLDKSAHENVVIALSEESQSPETRLLLLRILDGRTDISVESVPNAKAALKNKDISLIVDIPKDCDQKLKESKPCDIKLIYDQSDTRSETTYYELKDSISAFNKSIVQQRLSEKGISPDILLPVRTSGENTASAAKVAGSMAGMSLSLFIAMFAALGGIPAAMDLAAGEKERGTLEPLLATRVNRMSILAGKYVVVFLFSLGSALASFGGIIVSGLLSPSSIALGTGLTSADGSAAGAFSGLALSPLALLLMFLISATLALMFSGVELALSTYARSFKEASTYTSPLVIVSMVPAYAIMFVQPGDIPTVLFALPFVNAIAAFKELFVNIIDPLHMLLVFSSSLVYVGISCWICIKMFNREQVLFRS